MRSSSKALDMTALTLVVIGAINWGLVGLFKLDVIATLFGGMESWFSRIIYAVIGLAGLYCLSLYSKMSQERYTGDQSVTDRDLDRDHYQNLARSGDDH
ncbi:MAG: DUF378 domain-containing protein [Clostridiales bacterium]|jgi:uncharacterized membrane protein YuzA (DUF378 family)|nr:DUF378 domain-containing protein [Clostridiales bacterium]